ncbi:hypothetical protein EYZ11_001308 [Aspergillus tanneri]|uniref:E3 ubiquitin-protein ligase RNF216 RING finger HC subclass domain-containing protein n=1 Tax=Aspergillus tanneri TaxID=1220188 RepID=A0A4V3UQJ1_9EURO|nr:hypothetical protein EYZ11_001308 [Aspergillus tanneri]
MVSRPVSNFSRSPNSPSPSTDYHHQSATITEALRNHPFGMTLRSRSVAALTTLSDNKNKVKDQEELNTALETLARIFPDVKIEVFRELLIRFDGLSRLEVCVDQLLRYKEKWVAGRWNVPEGTTEGRDEAVVPSSQGENEQWVPRSEQFRSDDYKRSVKALLVKEFSSLNKSVVDAVLAEANFCYMRARPILRDLSSRTWRATFNNILPFRNKKDKNDHPLVLWKRQVGDEPTPTLKDTGCQELNRELHEAILAPLLQLRREEQEARDLRLAEELNEKEAMATETVYECECCLVDAPFERISTCSHNMHVICYSCIQRTVQEAVFGQGWGKSVDVERATLKCLAPFGHEPCNGSLNSEIVKQAILLDKAGGETYLKFEGRLASEALLKSQLKIIRCPFCSYAEVDSAYHPSSRGIRWRFRREGLAKTIFRTIILLDLVLLLVIPVILVYILDPSLVPRILCHSLLNLCLKFRPKKFKCANPGCARTSCITCQMTWRDPHVCYEPLLLDLRATVEAARTAAVKRICPRCDRARRHQENVFPVGPVWPRLEVDNDGFDADEGEAEVLGGYRHFCEHFRLTPGSRCSECNKCELYQDVDEEAVARSAGEKAEREWNMRQGVAGQDAGTLQVNNDFTMANGRERMRLGGKGCSYWLNEVWHEDRWKKEGQALVDWAMEQAIIIEDN